MKKGASLIYLVLFLWFLQGCGGSDAASYVRQGKACLEKGDFDGAILNYDKAIEISPNCLDAYYSRGLAHYANNDNDRAVADWTKCIEIDPGCAGAYLLRGNIYYQSGSTDSAIKDLEKGVNLAPDNPVALRAKEVLADLKKGYGKEEGISAEDRTEDCRSILWARTSPSP